MSIRTLVTVTVSFLTLGGDAASDKFHRRALRANSSLGRRLLDKAKVVNPPRGLAENNGNNYNYDNEFGLYNLPELYIHYTGCSSFFVPEQYGYNYGGQGQQNNNNNNGNYYDDNMEKSNLVLFDLCNSSSCDECSGEYAVDMFEFLDAFTEMQMQENEYQCEYVREHCYCQNYYYNNNYNNGGNTWESCLSKCFANAGFDGCMNEYYGGQAFQLQEYLECRQAFGSNNGENNNNNHYEQTFYVGPYCSEQKDVYLRAFYDEDCSYEADFDTFQAYNYGDGFPYFDSPILATDQVCVSCMSTDEDGGNGNNDNNESYKSNELCVQSAEQSIKCDEERGYSSGCYFLDYTLPCLDGRGCPQKESGKDSNGENGSHTDLTSTDLYNELVKKLNKNKRVAIMMGAIAGGLLLLTMGMCMYCCFCMRPSLLSQSKKGRHAALLSKA